MSRVLLVLGSALIVLLTAALVLPVFVSWNGYRPLVEARLERLLGRAVAIEGDLDVALLPTLRLRADRLVIGPANAPIATIAAVEVRSSVIAPVAPGLRVQSLSLRGLDAALRFGPDGRPVLDALEGGADVGAGQAGIDPDTLSIDAIVIDGARLSVAVEAGAEPLVLEDVDATGRATRLTGPWDLEGVLASGGRRFAWRVNTGESVGTQVRVKGRLEPLRPPTQRSDVAIVDATLAWGEESATAAPVSLDGQVSLTSTPPRAAEDAGLLLGLPWRGEARLRLDPSRVLLQDIALRLGPEEVAANLAGTASYAFGDARADMVLSARQIDIDRLFGEGAKGAIVPAELARALLDELAAPRRDGDGVAAAPRLDLGLEVEGIVAGGEVLRDLRLAARTLPDRRVRISELGLTLPGRAALRLAGTGDPPRYDGTAPIGPPRAVSDFVRRGGPDPERPFDPAAGGTFRGTIALANARPDVLMAWATGKPAETLLSQPIGLEGDIVVNPAAIVLDRATADLGPAGRLTGTLALGLLATRPEARRWAARLTGEALVLDRVSEAPFALLGSALGRPFELDLDLGRLGLGAVDATGLRVAATYDGTSLTLGRLAIADLGGAAIEATGAIEPAASDGTITLGLEATRLDGLLALARAAEAPPALVAAIEARADVVLPMALDGALAATRDEAGARTSLRLEGALGGTRTVLRLQRLGLPGEEARFAGFLDADASGSAALLAQIGLPLAPGAEAGAGPVDLSALDLAYEGTAASGTIDGALDAFGTRIDVTGLVGLSARTESLVPTLDLTVETASSDVARLLQALPARWTGDLTADLGADGDEAAAPLAGTFRLSRDAAGLRLGDIALTLGPRRIAGALALRRGSGGREVEGAIDVSSLPLPWLAGALLGARPETDGGAGGGLALSTRTFARAPLLAWQDIGGDDAPGSVGGGVDVTVGTLGSPDEAPASNDGAVAPVEANAPDARFRLSWPRDGLRVGDIDARVLGGQLTGRALVTSSAGSPQTELALDLALEGARLGAEEENAPLAGALDLRVSVEGSGRSPAALVASLEGDGSALASDLRLRDLAPAAFARTVMELSERDDVIEEVVAATFREYLLGGLVEIDRLEVPFRVADGAVRLASLTAEADGLSLRARGSYDLARAALDLDLTLTPTADTPDLGDATARAVIAAGPSVGFSVSADAPGEVAIDASALATAISVVGFEEEIGRLRAVEEEILERARLSREIVRQGEERRRRQAENASAASPDGAATDEAAPKDADVRGAGADLPVPADAAPGDAANRPIPAGTSAADGRAAPSATVEGVIAGDAEGAARNDASPAVTPAADASVSGR